MRVIVTGAAGFLGRALVARLQSNGDDVVATDREIGGAFAGDLLDRSLLDRLFADQTDAVVHLATVPGGAAETDRTLAWEVNVAATRGLIEAAEPHRPRFVFASSIAVFGDRLLAQVTDATPVAPYMLYGAHKVMMEEWIACQSLRGTIDGLSLRFPGIIARPRAPSGMVSAFMSDLFHAMRAGETIDLPVSAEATLWLLSREAAVEALIHALSLPTVPGDRRVTLPAQYVSMGKLVTAVARAAGQDPGLARFKPEARIEAAFGRLPPLSTMRADALGFRHDGSLETMVVRVMADLDREEER